MGGRFWWYFQLLLVLFIFMALGALLAQAFDSFDVIEDFGGACTRSLTQLTIIGFHQTVVMVLLALGFYGAGSRGKGLTIASLRDLFSLLLFGAFIPIFMVNARAYDVWSIVEGEETLSLFYLATFLTTVMLVGMASFGGLLESDKVALRSLGAVIAIIFIGYIPALFGGKVSWQSLIGFFMDLACLNLLCVLLKIVFFPAPILGAKIESKSILFVLALLIIVIGVPVAGATVSIIYGGLYWLVFCLPAQLLWNGGASLSISGPPVALMSHVIVPAAYVVYVFESSIFRGIFFILAIFKSMSDFGENYSQQIKERDIEALEVAVDEKFEVSKVRPNVAVIALGVLAFPLIAWWAVEVIDDSTLSPRTIGRVPSGFGAATNRAEVKDFEFFGKETSGSPATTWRLYPSLLALDGDNYGPRLGSVGGDCSITWMPLNGAGQDLQFFTNNEKMLIIGSQSNGVELNLIDLIEGKQVASSTVGEQWANYKHDFHGGQTIIISKEGKSIQIFDDHLKSLGTHEFENTVWNFLSLENGAVIVSVYEKGIFYKGPEMANFEKCTLDFTDFNRINLYHCHDKALIESDWQHLRLIDGMGTLSPVNIAEGGEGLPSVRHCNMHCQDEDLLYLGNGSRVMAIDLANKALLWLNDGDYDAMLALDGLLALFDKYSGELGVFDGKTGRFRYGYQLGHFFYAIDPSGRARPPFPAVADEGVLYCSTGHNRTVVAIEIKSGKILWESAKLETPCYSALAVRGKRLYLLDCRGRLSFLSLDD